MHTMNNRMHVLVYKSIFLTGSECFRVVFFVRCATEAAILPVISQTLVSWSANASVLFENNYSLAVLYLAGLSVVLFVCWCVNEFERVRANERAGEF